MKEVFSIMEMPKICRMLMIALVLTLTVPTLSLLSGCGGGGGGGTVVTPPAAEEYPNITMWIAPASGTEVSSPVNVKASMYCSTQSNSTIVVQMTTWDDGTPASEWKVCSTDSANPTIFEHVYYTDARVIRSMRAIAKLATNKSTPAAATLTINPTSPAPSNILPVLGSFGCDDSIIREGSSTSCHGPVSCPSGVCTCVLDCGDGSALKQGLNCSSSTNMCSYNNLNASSVTFYPKMYPIANISGTEYKGNALTTQVIVNKSSIVVSPAPKLSGDFLITIVSNYPDHLKLTKIINSSSYEVHGTSGTNGRKMQVLSQSGDKRAVSSYTANSSTWRDTTTTQEGWFTRQYFLEDDQGNEVSNRLTIEIKGDMTPPLVPTVEPVTTPVYSPTASQQICLQKQVSAIITRNGVVVFQSSNDERDDLIERVCETVSFSNAGTYTYTYCAKDAAGNTQSTCPSVSIQYITNGGGGGGTVCDSDGVCEANEGCSSCSSDCGVCGGGNCDNDGVCDSGENSDSCSADCGSGTGNNGNIPSYSYYTDTAATRIAYDSVNGGGFYYIEGNRLYRKSLPSGNQTGSWRLDNQGTMGLPANITDVSGIVVGNGKLFIADNATKLVYAFNIGDTSTLTYTYMAGSGMAINDIKGLDYYNGKIYTTDSKTNGSRIIVFNSSNGSQSLIYGTSGNDPGELSDTLCDITVDGGQSIIYVADCGNRKIAAYNMSGTYLREKTGLPLIGTLKARNISSLSSLLVFTDASGYRVYGYTDNGTISWLWSLGSTAANGSFQNAQSVTWNNSTSPSSNGQLLIADPIKGKTQIFTLQQ